MMSLHSPLARWFTAATLLLLFTSQISRAENCTNGWNKHKAKCYRRVSESILYEECDVECSTQVVNSTMLCIEDEDQLAFIHSFVAWQTHIGLRRYNESDDFAWFEGCNSTYTSWNTGEPNNLAGDELYVEMIGDYATWFDSPENYNNCACEYTLVSPADDDDDSSGGYYGSIGDDDNYDSTTTTIILVFTGFFGSLCMLCGPPYLLLRLAKYREEQDAILAGAFVNPGAVNPSMPAVHTFSSPTGLNRYAPVVIVKTAAGPFMQPTPTAPYRYPHSSTANLAMVYAAPHVEMVPLGATASASAGLYVGTGAGIHEDYVLADAQVVTGKKAGDTEK